MTSFSVCESAQKNEREAGDMAQQLWALDEFPEDPALMLNSNMVAHNCLHCSLRGSGIIFWPPQALGKHAVYRHISGQTQREHRESMSSGIDWRSAALQRSSSVSVTLRLLRLPASLTERLPDSQPLLCERAIVGVPRSHLINSLINLLFKDVSILLGLLLWRFPYANLGEVIQTFRL